MSDNSEDLTVNAIDALAEYDGSAPVVEENIEIDNGVATYSSDAIIPDGVVAAYDGGDIDPGIVLDVEARSLDDIEVAGPEEIEAFLSEQEKVGDGLSEAELGLAIVSDNPEIAQAYINNAYNPDEVLLAQRMHQITTETGGIDMYSTLQLAAEHYAPEIADQIHQMSPEEVEEVFADTVNNPEELAMLKVISDGVIDPDEFLIQMSNEGFASKNPESPAFADINPSFEEFMAMRDKMEQAFPHLDERVLSGLAHFELASDYDAKNELSQQVTEFEISMEIVEDNPAIEAAIRNAYENPETTLFIKEYIDSLSENGLDVSGVLKMMAIQSAPEASARIHLLPEEDVTALAADQISDPEQKEALHRFAGGDFDFDKALVELSRIGHSLDDLPEVGIVHDVEDFERVSNEMAEAFPDLDDVTIEGLTKFELMMDHAAQQIKPSMVDDVEANIPFNPAAEPVPEAIVPTDGQSYQFDTSEPAAQDTTPAVLQMGRSA